MPQPEHPQRAGQILNRQAYRLRIADSEVWPPQRQAHGAARGV